MGNTVSFGDSLIITLFSMVVVFLTLLIISYLIDLLRVTCNRGNNKKGIDKADTVVENKVAEKAKEDSDDEELVAVIAAAIAANLGVSVPDVNIKSIKRANPNTTAWADMGRREQVLGKL